MNSTKIGDVKHSEILIAVRSKIVSNALLHHFNEYCCKGLAEISTKTAIPSSICVAKIEGRSELQFIS